MKKGLSPPTVNLNIKQGNIYWSLPLLGQKSMWMVLKEYLNNFITVMAHDLLIFPSSEKELYIAQAFYTPSVLPL